MEGYRFLDERGTFALQQPENISGLYFPVAGEQGIKSAVTPNLGGDAKVDQNGFLLEPVSVENLHNNRSSRNFWCRVEGVGCWSVTGMSAEEQAKRFTDGQDESELTAGLMWQTVTRRSSKYGMEAKVTSFADVDGNAEVMYVEIANTGDKEVRFVPVAAIPIYGRSADNIRDHRHVTSLLHRIRMTECGVEVTPTLSFDERGHRKNTRTYFVCGYSGNGSAPIAFYPTVSAFIDEGGSLEQPGAVVRNLPGVPANTCVDGQEALGGLRFAEVRLEAGGCVSYTIVMGVTEEPGQIPSLAGNYATGEKTREALAAVQRYWEEKVNVAYHTRDQDFDRLMHWVSFQPILRRIYGCSFLPHHDYGKGGRGWRDLWQDCLALLLMNPDGVRQMLIDNFGGVRMDGTNATIIGSRQGEFIADRNNITRVWMDHGVWPYMTTELYIHQTGDLGLLEKKVPYFKDRQIARGTRTDELWTEEYGPWQKTAQGEVYEGTVLEHLLLQNLTAFYEVGEHNHIRLRGADWNDAMDMAPQRGESVAFANAYAGNLSGLTGLLLELAERKEKAGEEAELWICEEILPLLEQKPDFYASAEKKRELLMAYADACAHDVSGKQAKVSIRLMAEKLQGMADWLKGHIRATEWVCDDEGNGWFNGYYDDHGRRVEGVSDGGVRMMLTSQVFAVMAETASKEQVASIAKSADRYLYRAELGGYRLNTDFGEVKMDLGRMFGFAYGEKENGAVFSHMAVMYANALYRRGFVKEGYKALHTLAGQALNFPVSRIYPGIPEYFDGRGRGLYHYLTGAASWYMLTVITQMYGVQGRYGALTVKPGLLAEQFDEEGVAKLSLAFAGRRWEITYQNERKLEYGTYHIISATLDGNVLAEDHFREMEVYITTEQIETLSAEKVHRIEVVLG